MLSATELPTLGERDAALALMPWCADLVKLTGFVRGSLDNQAIDLIDAALGPNHVRAALVALYEGVDVLLQACIDLADSVIGESLFARVEPRDPLARDAALPTPSVARFPFRVARYKLEDAAVKVATAGDHAANVHVRLAWEANVATANEMTACGFDPVRPEPATWASTKSLRIGLRRCRKMPLGVFAAFCLNDYFFRYWGCREVLEARRLRDAIVHRDRPSYREAPAFGRTTVWTRGRFSITFPPPEELHAALPTLDDRRQMVARAAKETFDYSQATWEILRRFLRTVGVSIEPEGEGVKVSTSFPSIAGVALHPREQRDPGPFLKT